MIKKNSTLREIFAEAAKNYKKKNFQLSETLCYKIINIDPNHFESRLLLANIFAKNRDFKKAKKFLEEANELQPNNAGILNNLGTANKELKDLKNAIKYYKKVIQVDPNNTNAYYNLGSISYELKQLKEAKNYFQKTISIQPDFALPFFILGNIHLDSKEYELAISNYQKAIEINSQLPGVHNNLGLVFRILNDFKNAIKCYEKAIKIKDDYPGAHHNLALAYKESGKFNEAIQSHEMAIKYEPENLMNYYYLYDLKKEILNENLKNKIKKIIENNKSTKINIAYGNFLLSKYENKIKNYNKEFNYLIIGHKNFYDSSKTKFDLGIKYCFENLLQIHEKAEVETFGKENISNIKPIFIIGVPRCGSTLIEKIIGSGSKIIPIGEETAVVENFINSKILEKKSLNLGPVENIRNELTNIYKNRGLILEKCDFNFTDKSLNNFFYINLIRSIYPKAKIINCKRDTLSSIISIFQNNLTELAWAHSLENILKYFDNYFNIIEIYNKNNPDSLYEIQLEKLAHDPERESEKLMEFCELPWDIRCLEFYKRKDLFSKTASSVQIRQAVYKHSVDKYLPYKKILDKYGKKYSWFN